MMSNHEGPYVARAITGQIPAEPVTIVQMDWRVTQPWVHEEAERKTIPQVVLQKVGS